MGKFGGACTRVTSNLPKILYRDLELKYIYIYKVNEDIEINLLAILTSRPQSTAISRRYTSYILYGSIIHVGYRILSVLLPNVTNWLDMLYLMKLGIEHFCPWMDYRHFVVVLFYTIRLTRESRKPFSHWSLTTGY